jgi:prepilin-type N-terminal cleavage/methylation domain-containing protein
VHGPAPDSAVARSVPSTRRVFLRGKAGFTLIEVIVTGSLIGILALIGIPRYMQYRNSAYNGAAESLAKNFEICQGVYKTAHEGYTSNLNDLLEIDKNLLATKDITFMWISTSSSGYTFNVRHKYGTEWFTARE